MTKLAELTVGAIVTGVVPGRMVTVAWHGTEVIELTYKDSSGRVDHELLYRDAEPRARLTQAVENAFDRDHLRSLLDGHALVHDATHA